MGVLTINTGLFVFIYFFKFINSIGYFCNRFEKNYYYLLLNTEWRILNDWIHRSESGDLLPPLIAIRDCASRNMRDKSVCSAYAVKEHFEENIVPNLDKMKAPNAPLLKTVRILFICLADVRIFFAEKCYM